VHHAASAITAPDSDHLPAYWQFHDAVARAQLLAWLPRRRHLIVDVSGPRGRGAELAAMAGHKVLRVIDGGPASHRAAAWTDERRPREPKGAAPPGLTSDEGARREGGASRAPGGERDKQSGPEASGTAERAGLAELLADCSRLSFLSDGCADDVIAEDRALSTHLAAEQLIGEIARVLRPGGRVLACVDSLVLGMAVLADQHHWAHLVDLPHAEVVLVPWPDGTITRCYGPDQARELFSGAGLTVNWIRPRTVFSESMVTHVLRRDPASLPKLVRAELAARSDESLGAQLVISGIKA
jgi:SAM-dependent methyltransferase